MTDLLPYSIHRSNEQGSDTGQSVDNTPCNTQHLENLEGRLENTANDEDQELIRAWLELEPPTRRFVVQDLVPVDAVTSLFDDGGQGKSFLALYMAELVCLGEPFADKVVEQGTALYLDGELDKPEFLRRAYKVARGFGLPRPPHGLHYFQIPGSLDDLAVQNEVRRRANACGATFIVLDSLTMASYEANASSAQVAIGLIKFLESLGSVLAIDHTPKPTRGADPSQATQFGSAFKRNATRSQLQLVKAEGGAVTLLYVKSNFGSKVEPIHLGLEFTPNCICFERLEANDNRLAGIEDKLPPIVGVYRMLATYEGGATPTTLGRILDNEPKTIRNYLTALRKAGRVEPCGDGRWRIVQAVPKSSPIPEDLFGWEIGRA